MRKLKKTKKVKQSLLTGTTSISVGAELFHTGCSVQRINRFADILTVMEENPDCVLAENDGRHFLVSPERYAKLTNTVRRPSKKVTASISADVAKDDDPPVTPPTFKVAKVDTIWEHKDEFIASFPSLEKMYDASKALIGKASCTGCAANGKRNALAKKAAAIYNKSEGITLSDTLRHLLGPQFALHLAQLMNPKAPAGTVAKANGLHSPVMHSHSSEGYRPTCLDCVRKHLAQALILLQESEVPEYPQHFWMGVGHLAEAESESLSSYPSLAVTIREHRLAMMADHAYKPNLLNLFEVVDSVETSDE